jgi:hypothetical protein
MSYGFMAWAVDTEFLAELCGSESDECLKLLLKGARRDCKSNDDSFADEIADGAPKTVEALRQIIAGTVDKRSPHGALYHYAFKIMVDHFGRTLDNSAVHPWSPDFHAFDARLKQRRIPLSLVTFMKGLPIALPPPDDFPMCGWVDAATTKKIDAAFAKANLAGADEQTLCIRGWFREAAAAKLGIVTFYN